LRSEFFAHENKGSVEAKTMRAYLQISGVVFGVIALLHVARLLLGWPAQIADWPGPLWISWLAIPAAGVFSFWAFRLAGQARR